MVRKVTLEDINSRVKIPEKGKLYWYITPDGEADQTTWLDSTIDNNRFTLGNFFYYEEDAQFAIERLKVFAIMRRYCPPYVLGHCEYVTLTYNETSIGAQNVIPRVDGRNVNMIFDSIEDAKACAEELDGDRIKCYYFGSEG